MLFKKIVMSSRKKHHIEMSKTPVKYPIKTVKKGKKKDGYVSNKMPIKLNMSM